MLGKIITVFTPTDPQFHLALNAIGTMSNRFFHLVVRDTTVPELLISNNLLPTRIGMVPLDVRSNPIPRDKISLAKEIASKTGKTGSQVWWSMDCITLVNEKCYKALEWAFGEFLICETEELAERICYDHRIKVKVVTLKGIVYDPRGTVGGGYKKLDNFLEYYGNYKERCKESEVFEKEIRGLDSRIERERSRRDDLGNKRRGIEDFKTERRRLQLDIEKVTSELENGKIVRHVNEYEVNQE